MKRRDFIDNNRDAWDQLDRLIKKATKGDLSILNEDELSELLKLYRKVLNDIAYAETHFSDPDLGSYLNSLATRAHSIIFSNKSINPRSLFKFLWKDFPKTIQDTSVYIYISTCIFLVGTIIAFLTVAFDIPYLQKLIPDSLVKIINSANINGPLNTTPASLLSSLVMTNNIKVSFLALSSGFIFGLGPIYVLWQNGLILGGIAAIFTMAEKSINFWATVLPHGVIELPAIFIAGAAGLLIGKAIVAPGNYTRTHALRSIAPQIFRLIGGTVFLLIIAGIIEGFFSPKPFPDTIKLAFSLITFIILIIYLTRGEKPIK